MSEFTEMLERIRLDNLTGYLMYGSESHKEKGDNYSNIIEHAYDKIIEKIEKMYTDAERNEGDLYSAVLDFSIIHCEVYLEIGLLIGFNLYKNLEKGDKSLEMQSIKTAFAKWINADTTDKK